MSGSVSVASTRSKGSVSSMSTIDDSVFTMVVAIDIGTSYSGYAYCYRRNVEDSADNVILNNHWTGLEKSVSTFKTPSYLLLNEKREFEAYGYEAEKKYAELQQQGRHQRCYFFRRMKTKLAGNQNLKSSYTLKDETGKSIAAVKVFSMSIRYLKGHLLNAMRMRSRDISTEDVKWIVTVPSTWSDVSKQFMRQAAIQAGIPSERLKLALEAEAASVYCQHLPHTKGTTKLPITITNATYVVADIGGGKTDVVYHQRRQDGRLKEMNKGGGCGIGSGHVDNAFLQFLVRLFSAPVVREFLDECKVEMLELLREFEREKRKISPWQSTPIKLKLPIGLDRICRIKQNGDSVSVVVSKSVYRDRVQVLDNNKFLQIDATMSNEFFRATCLEIAKSIRYVLTDKAAINCINLVLVGGMAESTVLQDIVRKELEGQTNIQRIIVPPEPEIAVLKGAVLFGHNPTKVFQRVMRYTYGLRKARLFNPDLFPDNKVISLRDIDFITDIFSPFITAGTRAPVGFMSYDSLTSIEPFQKCIEIDIYYSVDLTPGFVTDKNCWHLGKVEYQIPNPSREERTIYIEFIFGDTELVINITDRKTASRFKHTFPDIEK